MGRDSQNSRETGVRKYPVDRASDPHPADRDSSTGRKNAYGLTEKVGDVQDKTRQSDAQDQRGRRG